MATTAANAKNRSAPRRRPGRPRGEMHTETIRAALLKAFVAHNEAVKATIPANQLLVYEVKEGWGPLCKFLGVPVPAGDFPRTNDRAEFWDRVSGKI